MTHDPLCPVPDLLKQGKTVAAATCRCEEYRRVREDERERLASSIDEDEHVGPILLSGSGERACSACGKSLTRQQDRCAAIEALGGER